MLNLMDKVEIPYRETDREGVILGIIDNPFEDGTVRQAPKNNYSVPYHEPYMSDDDGNWIKEPVYYVRGICYFGWFLESELDLCATQSPLL